MDIGKLKTNEVAENEGVWFPYGDASFLVARTGNKAYVKMITKLVNRHRITLDGRNEEADQLSEKLLVQTIASTILLGWKGNVRIDNELIEYSQENAEKALYIKEFRKIILGFADDVDAYRDEVEAAEKKS